MVCLNFETFNGYGKRSKVQRKLTFIFRGQIRLFRFALALSIEALAHLSNDLVILGRNACLAKVPLFKHMFLVQQRILVLSLLGIQLLACRHA